MRHKEEEQQSRQPNEPTPLLTKLGGQQRHSNPWHHETTEWSKTGRDIVQMIMDALRSLFG